MKEDLHSTLLVACPELCAGDDYLTLTNGSLQVVMPNGEVNGIDIVAFNCKKKRDLPEILHKLLHRFKRFPFIEEARYNVRFLDKVLLQLQKVGSQCGVPACLLEIMSANLHPMPGESSMIYLIERVVEL